MRNIPCWIIAVLSTLTSLTPVQAQSTFSKVYHKTNKNLTLNSSCFLPDGRIWMAGDYSSTSSFALEIDDTGQILSSHQFTGNCHLQAIAATADTGVFLSGYAYDSTLSRLIPIGIRLNKNSDTLWTFGYDVGAGVMSEFIIDYRAIQTSEGGFVMAGTTVNNQVYILKLSSSGALDWGRMIAASATLVLSDLTELPDSGIAILAHNPTGSYLFKLNANGALEWSKTILSNPLQLNSRGNLTGLSDGLLVTFGIQNMNGGIVVFKTYMNGNIRWSKSNQNLYLSYPNDYNVLRQARDGLCFLSSGSEYGYGVVFFIDSVGCVSLILDPKFCAMNAAVTADSGYIFVGAGPVWGSDFGEYDKLIGAFRVDSMFEGSNCLTGGSDVDTISNSIQSQDFTCTSVSVGIRRSVHFSLSNLPVDVYDGCVPVTSGISTTGRLNDGLILQPNPASGPFTVRRNHPGTPILRVELFDPSGRLVLSVDQISDEVRIDPGDLPPGVYTVQARTRTSGYLTGKIVLK